MKIPFGIAQIGKAFRTEIVARQFIFRMREFEQMEMQFFVRPGEEIEWFKKWKSTRLKWHQAPGLGDEKYAITIMRNWLTTLTQLRISSLKCRSDLRKWRVYIAVRTST